MATAVQLTLSLEPGNTPSLIDLIRQKWEALKQSLASTPNAGQQAVSAFSGIESAERRAHIGGQLFVRTFGVEMPRALETVIARSQALGPLLAGMFNVSVALAGAAAFGVVIEKIKSMTEEMGGYTEEVKKMEQETIQASRQAFVNPETLGATIAHLNEVNKQLADIQRQQQEIADSPPQESESEAHVFEETGISAATMQNEQRRTDLEREGTNLEQQRQKLLEQEAKQMQQIVGSLEEQAKLAGLTGKALINEQERQAIDKFNQSYGGMSRQSDQYQRGITAIHQIYGAQRDSVDQSNAQSAASRARANADTTIALHHQVLEDALQGEDKIKQSYADEMENLQRLLAQGLISRKDYNDRAVLYAQQAAEKEAALNEAAEKETEALELKARDASLQGDDLILAHKQDQLSQTLAAYAKHEIDVEQFERRIVAINADADAQIQKNDQQTADKRKQVLDQAAEDQKTAEQTIALASVNEWQKAYAQIEVEAQNKVAAIDKAERSALQQYQQDDDQYVAIEKASQAKRQAVWVETNQKIEQEHEKQVQQLGADLESLFNDIGSGNIGTRILNNMKKLFSQIVAQWLLSTNIMGNGFGSIFGSLLFGPGSAGANYFGGGVNPLAALLGGGGSSGAASGSSNPLAAILGGITGGGSTAATSSYTPSGTSVGSFFGSTSTAGTMASSDPFGLSSLFGSSASTGMTTDAGYFTSSAMSSGGTASSGAMAQPSLTSFGLGMLSGLTGSTTASGALTSGGNLSSIAGATAVSTLAKPSIGNSLGGLFSTASIPGLAMVAAMLGGKALGGVGQVGAMISALTLMATISPGGVATQLLTKLGLGGPLGAGILTAAGGGLLGFGVGEQFGPIAGAAAGVGTSLLLGAGLLGLGPVGLIIGAIVGLLGGIFGGLFGGSKRKKAANNYFTQQIQPAIKQIVDGFESFQIDFATANSQLEQLRTQAHEQLGKLKSQGNNVYKNKVVPAIDAAEKQINSDETERNRRAGLVFGPPQFHDGGLVNAAVASYGAKPGELLAMLKHGEFVVNPTAAAKNADLLEHMNRGGSVGPRRSNGAPISITIQALDGPSVDSWLRGGGAARIATALSRYDLEGH